MPEPKGNDVRTLAVRVSPDFHAQLSMVAEVDEMSLVDLMMQALENHVAARREATDFQAKVQQALEDAEAQMARTKAMLLGTLPEGAAGADLAPKRLPQVVVDARMSLPAEAGGKSRRERRAIPSGRLPLHAQHCLLQPLVTLA